MKTFQMAAAAGRTGLGKPRSLRESLVPLITGLAALACTCGFVLADTNDAQAGYWGCSTSYGNACWGKYQGIANLLTMDQDQAALWVERNPENGYPHPTGGHAHHYVCGALWSGGKMITGWSCAWEDVAQGGYNVWAEPMMGSSVPEGVISTYQLVNEI